MPLDIADHGRGNRIEIDPDTAAAATGALILAGDDNLVSIGPGCTLTGASLRLGHGCSLRVGRDTRLAAIETMAVRDGHIEIGEATNFTWHTRLLLHEAGAIRIGAACLVASDTLLSVSDMHSILDRRTGRRINPAADIVVEDEVWLGHEVVVLKGVRIGTGSVIGMGSVVSRDIGPNRLAVGRPAAVIREEIGWDPRLL